MYEPRNNLKPFSCVRQIALEHDSPQRGKKGKEEVFSLFILVAGKR